MAVPKHDFSVTIKPEHLQAAVPGDPLRNALALAIADHLGVASVQLHGRAFYYELHEWDCPAAKGCLDGELVGPLFEFRHIGQYSHWPY